MIDHDPSRCFELVTRAEAVRRTGIGRRQIDRAIERGRLPVYQLGAWKRLRFADVLGWIEANRIESGDSRAG